MIYCVEDEANIQELILYALRTAGFEAEGCFTASELDAKLKTTTPQLILLDIMLPEKDGLEILQDLRNNPITQNIPIIMITAKSSEFDKIKGLDSGADDYITKPIAIMEMISRIKALLRRCDNQNTSNTQNQSEELSVGNIRINKSKRIVLVNTVEVVLSFREFELLQFLLENKGMAFSRDKLLTNVWGYEYSGESRTVDVHIRTLRHKIGDDGTIIQTVRNIGYKIGD